MVCLFGSESMGFIIHPCPDNLLIGTFHSCLSFFFRVLLCIDIPSAIIPQIVLRNSWFMAAEIILNLKLRINYATSFLENQ